MTTKLLRNSFLIVLIPLIAFLYNKDENINVVNHPALRDKAAELSNILHLEYERNIKGQ